MTLTHKQTISLCIIFSWLFSINTLAQTAEDYFHDGAQTYIGGNLAGAMNVLYRVAIQSINKGSLPE